MQLANTTPMQSLILTALRSTILLSSQQLCFYTMDMTERGESRIDPVPYLANVVKNYRAFLFR